MIIELTKNEQITLLGLLEVIAQVDDVNEVLSTKSRIEIISIIQKLGGTYFGKIAFNLEEVYRYRVKDILSSFYGIQEGSDNGEAL